MPHQTDYTVQSIPLFVDLDGTLIATDCLWEGVLLLLQKNPLYLIALPFWLLQGKSVFKHEIALRNQLNYALLPYRTHLLDYLRNEKAQGREIILATATDTLIATPLAGHLGLFTSVLATHDGVNNSGGNKCKRIQDYCHSCAFDYIGNSHDDIDVWKASRVALVVSSSPRFIEKVRRVNPNIQLFEGDRVTFATLFTSMRVYQWMKNVLLFLPLLLAHKITDSQALISTTLSFLSFSFCASAVYILNDLFDVEADRDHPRKKNRPFASGSIPIPHGLALIPMLLTVAFGLSLFFLSNDFTIVLIAYLCITTAYTLFLKKIALVDVVILAGLYSYRLFAGSIAGNVFISQWLFAFSVFLFLSIAFVKRYAELQSLFIENKTAAAGRAYTVHDLDILRAFGTSSGLVSILIFALYVNSKEVTSLYHHPQLLWAVGMCLLYWVLRLWFVAHRGQMHDDPLIYISKDKTSYIVLAVVLASVFFAL